MLAVGWEEDSLLDHLDSSSHLGPVVDCGQAIEFSHPLPQKDANVCESGWNRHCDAEHSLAHHRFWNPIEKPSFLQFFINQRNDDDSNDKGRR